MKKLALLLIALFLLAGCGTKSETPEQAVTNALNAVKNLDEAAAQKYFTYSELFNSKDSKKNTLNKKENAKFFVENITFKTLSSSVEGDTATVKTEITNIDMKSILGEYVGQMMPLAFGNAFAANKLSDEEMDKKAEQILLDLLKRKDNKKATTTVDIQLTKSENSWKIKMDDSLQNAVLGGLKSAADSMNFNNSEKQS